MHVPVTIAGEGDSMTYSMKFDDWLIFVWREV